MQNAVNEAKALRRAQLASESAVRHLAVQSQQRRHFGPVCEACGRPTEYLFDGPVEVEVVVTVKQNCQRWTPTPMHLRHQITRKQMELGKVCQRCRPPSNLEIREMLTARRTPSK